MQVTKTREGWQASTEENLGMTAEGKQRTIEFSTHKGHKGLMTSCTIWEKSEGSKTTVIFGDDYKAPVQWTTVSRVTEKTVAAAHEALKDFIAQHIAAAKQFYGVA